jgi:hypothetical protein
MHDENEKRGVNQGGHKTKFQQDGWETSKPSLRSLFKSIDGLVKAANMIWFGGIKESLGLLHVHLLHERAIEEGIGDIQLPNGPIKVNRQS